MVLVSRPPVERQLNSMRPDFKQANLNRLSKLCPSSPKAMMGQDNKELDFLTQEFKKVLN